VSATAEERRFVRWTRTCDRCGFESTGEAETGHHAAVEMDEAGWLRIAYEYLDGDPIHLRERVQLLDPEHHERQHRWTWSERDLCPPCAEKFRTFATAALP